MFRKLSESKKSKVVKESVDKQKMLKHLLAFVEDKMKSECPKTFCDKIVFHNKMVESLASCLLVINFEACSPEKIKKLLKKDLKKSTRRIFCSICEILIVFYACR
jgi:hypothetical protein